jgi:enolase-phosphatase E1
LVAPLYPDVLPAVENARRDGLKIAIFSSGSVLAQRLLFAHTDAGDVTGLIDHYFDTTTGAKSASESYVRISRALDLVPAEVLFISDVTAELDAARAAGMRTLLCVRPGNPAQPGGEHGIIESFDRLTWLK